jgi:hypothetical protein
VGLNSPTSVAQARLLQALAERVRGEYEGLLGEPLPNQLNVLVEPAHDREETARQRTFAGSPLLTTPRLSVLSSVLNTRAARTGTPLLRSNDRSERRC